METVVPVNVRRKFMECSIISPAPSLLMKHLVIGQRQKAPSFSAFHWSPDGSLVSIGQHFVTTRVVHLPIRTETSLITEADLITESDQTVRAVHSCNSWFWLKTLVALIRRRVLWRLISISAICLCPFKVYETLDIIVNPTIPYFILFSEA